MPANSVGTSREIAVYENPLDRIDREERSFLGSADAASTNASGSVALGRSTNPSGFYDPSPWQQIDPETAERISMEESIEDAIKQATRRGSAVEITSNVSEDVVPSLEANTGKNWLRRLHRLWRERPRAPVIPPAAQPVSKLSSDGQSEGSSRQDSEAIERLRIVYDGLSDIGENAKSTYDLLAGINSLISLISSFESQIGGSIADNGRAASIENDESKASVVARTAEGTGTGVLGENQEREAFDACGLDWKSVHKLQKVNPQGVYHKGCLISPNLQNPMTRAGIDIHIGDSHLLLSANWKNVWETKTVKLEDGVGFWWSFREVHKPYGGLVYDVYVRPDLSRIISVEEDILCARLEIDTAHGKVTKKTTYFGVSVVDVPKCSEMFVRPA